MTKKKNPATAEIWFPMYIGDYLASTGAFTTLHHGACLLLLMHAWRHDGYLPMEEEQLAAIAKLGVREWRKAAPVLMTFWSLGAGGYTRPELLEQLAQARRFVQTRRENGAGGGRPKGGGKPVGKPSGYPSGSAHGEPSANLEGELRETQSQSQLKPNPTPDVVGFGRRRQSAWPARAAVIGDDWLPSAMLGAKLLRAGINPGLDSPGNRVEFISYWQAQGNPLAPEEWEHLYFSRLQHLNVKKSEVNHGNGFNGSAAGGRGTAAERVAAALQAGGFVGAGSGGEVLDGDG